MSIGIYRNILNREMKRFGKFGKNIVTNLNGNNIEAELIFTPKLNNCLTKIRKHETIVFITHGSAENIYHKFDLKNSQHQVLIGKNNISILKGKKVIAISCGTARVLGENACKHAGCITYFGFYNKIHLDKLNGNEPSLKYRMFISQCYKDTFEDVLQMALENKWTFSKLKIVMERELKKTVVSRAKLVNEEYPRYYKSHEYEQSILAVSNVASNIYLYGDEKEKVS